MYVLLVDVYFISFKIILSVIWAILKIIQLLSDLFHAKCTDGSETFSWQLGSQNFKHILMINDASWLRK